MYKPYPIYDMRTGKKTDTEPWLLPKDGFETLSNCRLKKGVLEKRKGYSFFGQHLEVDTSTKAPTLQTNPIMGIFNHYTGSSEQLIIMDQDRICKYLTSPSLDKDITAFSDAGGGEVQAACEGHGFVDDDKVTISGTTNYNGTFNITKVDADNFKFTDTWVSDDGTGSASQEKFLDLTRHKIRFKHASKQTWSPAVGETVEGATSGATGEVAEVIVDTGTFGGSDANGTIIFVNGSVTGTFNTNGEDLFESGTPANIVGEADGTGTDDEFTGDNTNFFWLENWGEVSYITNNNDVIQKYNGTNLSRLHIDLDVEGGPDNDVTSAKLIFALKQKLVIFDITERGSDYHQRARWSENNDVTTWKDANYIDADTDEWIISADFIGDNLIVFFERSVWKFSYTGDPDQPFRWDRVDSVEGCYAQMSIVAFSDELFGVGPTRLVGTDGRETYGIDERIPDFMLEWTQNSVSYSYSLVVEEEREALISYTSQDASAHNDGNTYPDRLLVLNYEDNSFSTYGIETHCMGYSSLESDLILDDIDDALDDIDYSFDDKSLQAGYPTTLFGTSGGMIYKMNDTGADNGADIEFSAVSGQWNPFTEQGLKARLGWIDFLVDVDSDVTFDVENYINTDTSYFQLKTVTCEAVDGSDDMAWHRVFVGAEAAFHRINITNNASANRPRIHAIVPYFEEGAPLI